MEPAESLNEALKREWTDQYVEVNPERPELKRFAGIVGRVVTVNCNSKAWSISRTAAGTTSPPRTEYLRKLDPADGQGQVRQQRQQRPAVSRKQG